MVIASIIRYSFLVMNPMAFSSDRKALRVPLFRNRVRLRSRRSRLRARFSAAALRRSRFLNASCVITDGSASAPVSGITGVPPNIPAASTIAEQTDAASRVSPGFAARAERMEAGISIDVVFMGVKILCVVGLMQQR